MARRLHLDALIMVNMGPDRIVAIAGVVHGAMRVYGALLGEPAEPTWDRCPSGRRAAVITGVTAIVSGAANAPEELHAVQVLAQLDPGGTPGVHPVSPAFEALSLDQRRKTTLFRAIVMALVDGPCQDDCHDPGCAVGDPHPCHLDTCLSEFGVPPPERDDLSGHGPTALRLSPLC